MVKAALNVFSDRSESINYNFPDFPLYINTGKLEYFYNYKAENHWHDDLEFLLVTSGELEYFINGTVVTIHTGECIFVNSQRMHYGFSSTNKKCSFIVIAMHPSLFYGQHHLFNVYWKSKFSNSMENYRILKSNTKYGREIINIIRILQEYRSENQSNPFYLISKSAELVYLIGEQLEPISAPNQHELSWTYFINMLDYIYQHYEEKILVADIAEAGQVCRSHCYTLFEEYANSTPIDFLNQYRLKKSIELLKETNRSITEIALKCGFQSNSYYSYYFKTEMEITPNMYRKTLRSV